VVPARFDTLPITRIGTIREGRPGLVELGGRKLKAGGWDHFARSGDI
jgi:hypothetical protein